MRRTCSAIVVGEKRPPAYRSGEGEGRCRGDEQEVDEEQIDEKETDGAWPFALRQ
jgi:hypothetical protein